MTTPITPDEVVSVKKDELPEGVLDIEGSYTFRKPRR